MSWPYREQGIALVVLTGWVRVGGAVNLSVSQSVSHGRFDTNAERPGDYRGDEASASGIPPREQNANSGARA